MPEVPMSHILGYCNYVDIQRLRKTCHGIRDSIATINPTVSITKFNIKVRDRTIELSLKYPGGYLGLIYCENGENTSINFYQQNDKKIKNKTVQLGGIRHMDAFLADFRLFFDLQKYVMKSFTFGFMVHSPEIKNKFCEKFVATQQAEQIKTEFLQMFGSGVDQIPRILPFFDASALKTLRITNFTRSVEFINGIVDLEQWKRAESVCVGNFYVSGVLDNISHFESFLGRVESITMDNVQELRKKFMASPNFQQCQLHHHPDSMLGTSPEDPLESNHPNTQFYYRTPIETNIFFVVVGRVFVHFEVINVENVPKGVNIIEIDE